MFNSPSGDAVLVDCRTKGILGVEVYSMKCGTCDRGKYKDATDEEIAEMELQAKEPKKLTPAEGHRCPKNYEGSSKGMEAMAAATLVTRLYNTGKAWAHTMVGDDDSSTRAVLHTDWKVYAEDHPDRPKEDYWPSFVDTDGRTKFVAPRDLKGGLHYSIPPPVRFLADPTHRFRVIGGKLYAMANQETTYEVTNADAARIKQNFGYVHKQNCYKSYEDYERAMKAALEHHGIEHIYCDISWCPYKKPSPNEPPRIDPRLNRRSVKKGTKKWKNIESVHTTYTTKERLLETFHTYDSQKNEAFNKRVTAMAPKDRNFCFTKSLSDRIALCVIIDSVGYSAGISRVVQSLCGVLGRTLALPPATQQYLHRKDRACAGKTEHQQKIETKKKRAAKGKRAITRNIAADKKAKRKGMYYGTGYAVEDEETTEAGATATAVAPAASRVPASEKVCPLCGLKGHTRRTSKKCRFYTPPLPKKTPTTDDAEPK
jgi:hypothetical protein